MNYEGKADPARLIEILLQAAENEPDVDWIAEQLGDIVETPFDAFMVTMTYVSYVATVFKKENPKSGDDPEQFYKLRIVNGEPDSALMAVSQMIVAYMNDDMDICTTIAQTRCLEGEEEAIDLVSTALRFARALYVSVREASRDKKGKGKGKGKGGVVEDGGESIAFE